MYNILNAARDFSEVTYQEITEVEIWENPHLLTYLVKCNFLASESNNACL